MNLIRIGEITGGQSDRAEVLAGLWRGAGFNARAYDDIQQLIWEKFLCNVTYSAACTVFDMTVGELQAHPERWAVALGAMQEANAIARAKKIKLTIDDPVEYVTAFGAQMPDARPSMLLDHKARRRSELDAINGQVPELGVRWAFRRRTTTRWLQCCGSARRLSTEDSHDAAHFDIDRTHGTEAVGDCAPTPRARELNASGEGQVRDLAVAGRAVNAVHGNRWPASQNDRAISDRPTLRFSLGDQTALVICPTCSAPTRTGQGSAQVGRDRRQRGFPGFAAIFPPWRHAAMPRAQGSRRRRKGCRISQGRIPAA